MVSESKKADSDTSGRGLYRGHCAEMLDRRALTGIRRGAEKGLGIGQAECLLRVARLKELVG